MLPFCGYNMADYFGNWLRVGRQGDPDKLPRIFYVNWFRKDADGDFLWPGFGDNSRVLKWIFQRCDGEAEATETPIGLVPAPGSIDTDGLELAAGAMEDLLTVDPELVRDQLPQVEEHLARFGDSLPAELRSQFEALKQRLG
jgi:phosphoenolpyruvate carboxykinase (GTP)